MAAAAARKAGFVDTAFDHQLHNAEEDEDEDLFEDDQHSSPVPNETLEFSNSYNVMRLIRLIIVLQTIAIIIDNPSFEMSIFFRVVCRGFLMYSIQFYSRPFIDLVYIIQLFYGSIIYLALLAMSAGGSQEVPKRVEVGNRRLSTNP
jgi:hypothetical protein